MEPDDSSQNGKEKEKPKKSPTKSQDNDAQSTNLLDSEAPGFIVVNQSGQLITAAELSVAISQQMQMYALENRLPVVLTNMKTNKLKEDLKLAKGSEPGTSHDNIFEPPPSKIQKLTQSHDSVEDTDDVATEPSQLEQSFQTILEEIQASILTRLDNFGKRVEDISSRCQFLEHKVSSISAQVRENGSVSRVALSSTAKRPSSIIVGLQVAPNKEQDTGDTLVSKPTVPFTPSQVEQRNREEDYPNGSWLGNKNDPEKRVRCEITELDLNQINQCCKTPEKMALTLLDYLFDRETQANSNISGNSKYEKAQLDPWKIYGLKCHIEYRFGLKDEDWHRIKQNIDSKCRTAFRRKQKGLALKVKAFSKNSGKNELDNTESISKVIYTTETSEPDGLHDLSLESSEIEPIDVIPVALHKSTVFSLPTEDEGLDESDIQTMIHATPEQIAQFQQSFQETSPQMPTVGSCTTTNTTSQVEDEKLTGSNDSNPGSETP